jgi:DNA polymerase III subunit chi
LTAQPRFRNRNDLPGNVMTQVDFYISCPAPIRRRGWTLPANSRKKPGASGHRMYLHCSDAAQRDDLDARLWRFKGESFVPHGPAESEPDSQVACWSWATVDARSSHQDLLVNLDLKVPILRQGVSPASRKWWWKIRLFVWPRVRVSVSTANRAILCKTTELQRL